MTLLWYFAAPALLIVVARIDSRLVNLVSGIVQLVVDELQADLDAWMVEYNEQRPHQGRWCFGKTPMHTFLDALPLAKEKIMAA